MLKLPVVALALLVSVPAVSAETVIETSLERLPAAQAPTKVRLEAASGPLFTKDGMPTDDLWLLPFSIDETTPDGSSTFFAVRNEREDTMSVGVIVDYFDEGFNNLFSEMLTLDEDEVRTRNLRAISQLVAPGAVSRGVARLTPDGDVSVDFFQLDVAGNFATGGLASVFSDWCENWMARFLRFGGAAEGSGLRMIINGPLGVDGEPTVTGEIYNEAGAFINSFTIRTNEWFLEVDALDLVIGETAFGSIELRLDTEFLPRGFVFVEHSAFGLYSIGARAICKDLPV